MTAEEIIAKFCNDTHDSLSKGVNYEGPPAYGEHHARGIIRALADAGFDIVPKEPTEEMCEAGATYYDDSWRKGHAKEDTSMVSIWSAMIGVAK